MEHLADICPFVQILDADALFPFEQCAEIWKLEDDIMGPARLHDRQVAEHVIAVPTFSCSPCPSRVPVSEPQTVEQLVEVPTVLSLALLQQTAEQTIDIPVPHGGGCRPLQGSLPRQSSTAAGAVQSVDIPVRGGLHGFLPGQKLTQRTVEQLVDSSSGGLQDFHLDHRSAASSSGPADVALTGFFALFPGPKKSANVGARSRSELAAHSSSSTPGAYGVVCSLEEPVQEEKKEEHEVVFHVPDSIVWVHLCDDKGKTHHWNRRTRTTKWKPPPGIRVVWVGSEGSRRGL